MTVHLAETIEDVLAAALEPAEVALGGAFSRV